MDRYHVDQDKAAGAPGIDSRARATPHTDPDGISVSCTLGNSCHDDRLLPEQDAAALYVEPLGILWHFNFASHL